MVIYYRFIVFSLSLKMLLLFYCFKPKLIFLTIALIVSLFSMSACFNRLVIIPFLCTLLHFNNDLGLVETSCLFIVYFHNQKILEHLSEKLMNMPRAGRTVCCCFTYASHLLLFSRSEPYVEVKRHSSSMKAALAFQRNWAQESSRVNQLN